MKTLRWRRDNPSPHPWARCGGVLGPGELLMSATALPQRCHAPPLGKGGCELLAWVGARRPWERTRRPPLRPLGKAKSMLSRNVIAVEQYSTV